MCDQSPIIAYGMAFFAGGAGVAMIALAVAVIKTTLTLGRSN
jgi:hypothetical protein